MRFIRSAKAVLTPRPLLMQGITTLNGLFTAAHPVAIEEINPMAENVLNYITQLPHYNHYLEPRDTTFPEQISFVSIRQALLLQLQPVNLVIALAHNLPILSPYFQALDVYRLTPDFPQRFVNSLVIHLSDEVAALIPNPNTLLGAEFPFDGHVLGQVTVHQWAHCIAQTTERIHSRILSSELLHRPRTNFALQYLLKAIYTLIAANPVVAQPMPQDALNQFHALRNYFAHSNPYVELSNASTADWVLRYTSMLLKEMFML